MMALRSSLTCEQRFDARFAGEPANPLPLRYLRL